MSAAPATWPDVSVIVPTHGRPELVREAVAAITAQTYPGQIECIVVHDQETPNVALRELATPRCSVMVTTNSHSAGLAGARNTGLDVARGTFIASCDDDDIWHQSKLARQISRLIDDPALLVVGCGLRFRLPGGRRAEWPARSTHISYELLLRNRVKELHSSTLVMRRDAFAKAGTYDEDLPGGYAEDYDWVLRAARVGKVGAVVEPLADIRKDVPSYYRGRAERTCVALEHFLDKHTEIKSSARGHARMLGQIAFARSSSGDRLGGLRYACRALVRWPLSPYAYMALAHTAIGVSPERLARGARLFGRGIA
jgi:glycosyltransferase involved in cell wall biosynthesis